MVKSKCELGKRIQSVPFDYVLTSPLHRANQTCQLAGMHNKQKLIQTLLNGTMATTKDKYP